MSTNKPRRQIGLHCDPYVPLPSDFATQPLIEAFAHVHATFACPKY